MFGRRSVAELWGIEKRATPAPISILPSGNFKGNDGNWSTFTIRIGTPAQNSDVLISTLSSDLWAVGSFACSSGPNSDPNCVSSRGGNPSLFDSSSSTTWQGKATYTFAIDTSIGIQTSTGGNYGFDTVGMFTQGTAASTVQTNQVVSTMNANELWLGLLGLSPRTPNFQANNTRPSYLTSLYNQSVIPSLAYSYTAGAYYRGKTNASLTLGGYDSSTFNDPGLYFKTSPDNFRDLVVGVQSIQYSDSTGSKQTLKGDGFLAMIDSTLTPMWLPQDACDNFVKAFGLTVNSLTQQYQVNGSMHDRNLKNNATVDLMLGSNISGGQTTKISMPYAAFDLNYTNPTSTAGSVYYFPLRVASSSNQYTLGRAFLQEAVLTVDYGRGNFTVAQALTPSAGSRNIIAISNGTTSGTSSAPSPSGSGGSGNGGDGGSFVPSSGGGGGGSNAGPIAGGVVGGIVALAAIAGLLFFCLIRKPRKKREAEKKAREEEEEKNRQAAAAMVNNPQPHPNAYEKDGENAGSPGPPQYSGPANDYFGKTAGTTTTPWQVNKSNPGTPGLTPGLTPGISEPAEIGSPSHAHHTATVNNLTWQDYNQHGLHPMGAAGGRSPGSMSSGSPLPSPPVELDGNGRVLHEMASPVSTAHEMPSPQPQPSELYSPAVPVSAITPTTQSYPTASSTALAPGNAPVSPPGAGPSTAEMPSTMHHATRSSATLPKEFNPLTGQEPMPRDAQSRIAASQRNTVASGTTDIDTDAGSNFQPSPDPEGHGGTYFTDGEDGPSRRPSVMSATGVATATPVQRAGSARIISHNRNNSQGDMINRVVSPMIPEEEESGFTRPSPGL